MAARHPCDAGQDARKEAAPGSARREDATRLQGGSAKPSSSSARHPLRRPLVLMAAAFALGIALTEALLRESELLEAVQRQPGGFWLAALLPAAACGAALLQLKKERGRCLAALFAVFFFAGSSVMAGSLGHVEPLVHAAGESISFRGTVLEVQKKEEKTRLLLRLDSGSRLLLTVYAKDGRRPWEQDAGANAEKSAEKSVDTSAEKIAEKSEGTNVGKNAEKSKGTNVGKNKKSIVTGVTAGIGSKSRAVRTTRTDSAQADAPAFVEGQTVSGTAKLELPSPARNPGTFDYRRYLRSKRVQVIGSTQEGTVAVHGIAAPLRWRLAVLWHEFLDRLGAASDVDTGMLQAMLFGDKSGLEEERYERFQKNGTAHILAVSGLHIGMIYALAVTLLGGRRRVGTNLAILALLCFYAALAGFSASVMRAVLMIALHVCARLGHRRYDLMSAAAAAALLLLALNPWQLFALGFQLSFLAVFSLAAGLPLFRNLPLPPPVRDLLLPVLVIQCGMAPYSAYAFHCFSPGAFFANIPVVFLAGLAVPAGVLALPLTAVLPSLSGPLGTFLDLNLTLLEAANDLFYAGGRTSLTVTAPPLPLLLAFYALLFFFTSELARIWWLRRRWKPLLQGLGLAALLVLLLTRGFGSDFRGAQAVFVDVGQGSCIHLRTPSGRQVLIDGGGRHGFNVGKKILRPYLLHSGVRRIDLALATHRDTDHYQGLLELQEQGMVDRLLTTGDGLEVGDVLLREPGFRITVVAPVAEHEEENERSLVFRVDFDDWSLLATGDIGAETEAEIAAYWRGSDLLDVDVLAVPHHGSRRSSSPALLRAASPAAAVIQVGKNIYGHPAPQTLDAYRRAGIPVFRCDRQGAAAVRPGFRWRTMLKDRSAEPK